MEDVKNTPETCSTVPTEEQVANAISNVNPDVVLRNLAFWLDVAIARGRWVDSVEQKNAVSEAPTDN